jgi:hypothetical protein
MSVEVLTVCEWVGGIRRDTETTHPTWSDVEAAIRTLDNDRFNDLYLQPRQNAPETYLCVGGGGGRYVVSGSVENEAFPTVIDPAKADAPQELLVVGGQSGWYPASMVVDLETALNAARNYFETGEPSGPVAWQHLP